MNVIHKAETEHGVPSDLPSHYHERQPGGTGYHERKLGGLWLPVVLSPSKSIH